MTGNVEPYVTPWFEALEGGQEPVSAATSEDGRLGRDFGEVLRAVGTYDDRVWDT